MCLYMRGENGRFPHNRNYRSFTAEKSLDFVVKHFLPLFLSASPRLVPSYVKYADFCECARKQEQMIFCRGKGRRVGNNVRGMIL